MLHQCTSFCTSALLSAIFQSRICKPSSPYHGKIIRHWVSLACCFISMADFCRWLEVDREVIRVLYDKIAQDTRHWNAKILLEEQGERNFGQWSMGFKELNVGDADPGLIDLTRAAIDGLIKPTGAHAILTILIN